MDILLYKHLLLGLSESLQKLVYFARKKLNNKEQSRGRHPRSYFRQLSQGRSLPCPGTAQWGTCGDISLLEYKKKSSWLTLYTPYKPWTRGCPATLFRNSSRPSLRSSMNSGSKMPSSLLRKGSCLVKALPGREGIIIWTVLDSSSLSH